mmetsp:Transcript_24535/g.62133  ORF Transcript_24535/g.62133 Transcript_24535/m.62133 type:complete len:83 (-) Transcript_24535:308-556(-)
MIGRVAVVEEAVAGVGTTTVMVGKIEKGADSMIGKAVILVVVSLEEVAVVVNVDLAETVRTVVLAVMVSSRVKMASVLASKV